VHKIKLFEIYSMIVTWISHYYNLLLGSKPGGQKHMLVGQIIGHIMKRANLCYLTLTN
jgi:hypothetical protein